MVDEVADLTRRWRTARAVWWSAAGVLLLVTVLAPSVVPPPDTSVPAALPVALTVSVVLAALAGVEALDRGLRTRTPADDASAVAEVASRLVVQVALLEAPALLAVLLAAVVGPPAVAAVGGAGALLGLLRVRPSAGRLARLASSWRERGADVHLTP